MARRGYLSNYFAGAGAKVLRGTEVDPAISRGHEFQGVDAFRAFLGTPVGKERVPVTYIWMDDEQEEPDLLDLHGTWYDSRRGQGHRGPEYRLYYPKAVESIVHRAREGDTLFLCMARERRVLAILCPSGSSTEQKFLWLFNLSLTYDYELAQRALPAGGGRDVDFAARFILGELGLEPEEPEPDALDRLLDRFGFTFPGTARFSAFARETLKDVDPRDAPDSALISWMEHEEALFRHLERRIVARRLSDGFTDGKAADVDGFLSFSLSVQNRRKSRAGWAFGHHVEAILKTRGVQYRREATTEKRNAADFLFPSEAKYHDSTFPEDRLTMLALKTSCKDRWRQVLAEANRISPKHLLTLEPGISETQTNQMQAANLQLVLPAPLHETYRASQRRWLIDLRGFLETIEEKAIRT